MRFLFYFLTVFFVLSCNSNANEPDNDAVKMLTIQPSANTDTIKKAVTEIETKNLQLAGMKILSLQINGMEVIKISLKDYYKDERNAQQIAFKNYMEYLDNFAKGNSPLAKHSSREESKAKHDAVIKYLDKQINTSTEEGMVYKVVYYLNATTNSNNFNQLKTTYLDAHFNRKVMDYSFLNAPSL